MPKKSSKRVMVQRKRDCDRISFVVPKDGRHIIRAQALREGITSAEVIRRAVLARCGLVKWPGYSWPHFRDARTCTDKKSADRAITGLQKDEFIQDNAPDLKDDDGRMSKGAYLTIMLSSQKMQDEYIAALLEILDAVEDAETHVIDGEGEPSKININKKSIAVVQRLFSNIREVTMDDDDWNDD